MFKRRLQKISSLLITTAILSSAVLTGSLPMKVYAKEKDKSYIIITKSSKSARKIDSKYNKIIDSQEQNTELLKDESILVSNMTASEATMIAKDDNVEKVEEDKNVSASATTEYSSKEKKNSDIGWNLKSINSDYEEKSPKQKVKVALLDSGVDFQDNINVKERINLITDEDELSAVFEDDSNHGTSIASIIAGEGSNVKGVNKNIELYSARILNEKKQAPISRVIQAIYWAIDKKVNIINISFGTRQYSEALKQAIDAANKNGILVIAAAGNQGENGSNNVEYPAAFKNVMAVGSVDSKAKLSNFSSTGNEIDIVAPGEGVRATGAFGETMVTSGTSMSVPHVVGVASRLWQKDLSKSNIFIRHLIEESANSLGSKEKYGYGIVDCKYAEKMYLTAEKQFQKNHDVTLKPNQNNVKTFHNPDEENVTGTWSDSSHKKYLTDNGGSGKDISIMKEGAIYPDKNSAMQRMTVNPDFHGYYKKDGKKVNYLASYRCIIKIADAYGRGDNYTAVKNSDISGLSKERYDAIQAMFKKINSKVKSYEKKYRRAFVFGIAMHSATDAFAHSTLRYYKGGWHMIGHTANVELGLPDHAADKTDFVPARFKMAYRVERNNLYRYQGKRKDVAVCHDFHAANAPDYYPNNPTFRIQNILTNAKEAKVSDTNVIAHFTKINNNWN